MVTGPIYSATMPNNPPILRPSRSRPRPATPEPPARAPPVLDFYEGHPLDLVLSGEIDLDDLDDEDDDVQIVSHTTTMPPPSQIPPSQVVTRSKTGRSVKKEPEAQKKPTRARAEVAVPLKTSRIRVEGPMTVSEAPEPSTPRSKGKGKTKAKPSISLESPYKKAVFQTIPPVLLEGIASELSSAPMVSYSFLSFLVKFSDSTHFIAFPPVHHLSHHRQALHLSRVGQSLRQLRGQPSRRLQLQHV